MRERFLAFAILILLVAAFLRTTQLAEYPPGPHFDEAANMLIARSIAFDGANLFPIANSYQGRETLYHYLTVPMLRYVGDDVFQLRLVSGFMNLLTIAAAMSLAKVMFRGRRGWIIGMAVGVMMTISFHQILMSRQAYRAVSLPMMQALGLLFLWRGLRVGRQSWFWLALGGVFSGGVIYTYMASRLFPIWLALGGLVLLWLDRAHWRLRRWQGAIFFGVMLIVMLPMIDYALDHPDIFLQRLNEVSEGAVRVSLAESIRRHLAMFFVRGDFGNLRYNIPGRPYFTAIEGTFLLLGIAVALRRLLNGRLPALQRTAYFMTLLAPLMIIPSVVSVAGYPPSHMRSLGMVPLIFLLAAIGFEATIIRIALFFDHLSWPLERRVMPILIFITLLVGGGLVHSTYMRWAQRSDLYEQADGDLAAAAQWLKANANSDEHVYVASFHREHPTLITGYDGPVTWLGNDSLFLPPEDDTGLIIFSRSAPPSPQWRELLQPMQIMDLPLGPDGQPAFTAYRISVGQLSDLRGTASDVRNNLLAFVAISDETVESGNTAVFTMQWRVLDTPPYYRLRPVVILDDRNGQVLASADLFLLGTSSWRPDETLLQQVNLDIPVGVPPGDYSVRVAWVDRDTDTYLPYIDSGGASAGIFASIGRLTVVRPQVFPAAATLELDHREPTVVTAGVTLLGWNNVASSLRPGEALTPVLYWQATSSTATRDEFELRALLRSDRVDITLYDQPLTYSPSSWIDGEIVRTGMQWSVPREVELGDYTLVLQLGDVERVMGLIQVNGIAREFQAPSVDEIVNQKFGEALELYGYSLAYDDGGIDLTLIWHALAPVQVDYTVFVHLLNAEDVIVAQQDAMPRQYAYPTSLWEHGEYISDPYHFDVSSDGIDSIRVGLYVQQTGERLPVTTFASEDTSDHLSISIP